MAIIKRLASVQGSNSDVLNQFLAQELAELEDRAGIQELMGLLTTNTQKSIRSDCIKTIYEIGYLKPVLIAPYVNVFISLLADKNNRLVWGSMIALACVANLKAEEIWQSIDLVVEATEKGSIIIHNAGIRVISAVAAHLPEYEKYLFPLLMRYLSEDRIKDVAKDAENIFMAVNEENKALFVQVLEVRKKEMKKNQIKRVDRLLNQL